MKKSISMFIEDEVCIKHLGSLFNILNVYCHGLWREGFIKQGWKISIEECSWSDQGGVTMVAVVEVLRPGTLPFFEAYKRHSSFLGASNQAILNHIN